MDFITQIFDNEDKSCLLKNCIRNNFKHIRKWALRTQTNAFRIYDRDIKEFPLAIDFYDHRYCIHYFSFSKDSDQVRPDLKDAAESALFSLFQARPEQIFWRTRFRRDKVEQYEKTSDEKDFFQVLEYGVKFWINLTDYLDTGLFLDHREIRKYISTISKDKKVLNLFAYTCSFSVHAAKGGACFTKSVDMSNTYTAWGRKNLILNGFSSKDHEIVREDCLKFLQIEKHLYDIIIIDPPTLKNNEIVRADCLKFLDDEIRSGIKYDIIIIDPPTLSRSKKMDQMFDVQKDYVFLISKALNLLTPQGVIFFSTNLRTFVLEKDLLPKCNILDVTKKTLPLDFRDPKIHQCYRITKAD